VLRGDPAAVVRRNVTTWGDQLKCDEQAQAAA